ncbi:hypothetical protein NDU88_008543 [Pleurodeles waltl]|uniref:Uncharacterized protein n=1 Tax=Pleurodeles waltl TaxID=8319 RepID=A0AAV7P3X8_PLEWA|nr:hypothetical protein NDU88_008543 [Pleurodeles waltl]
MIRQTAGSCSDGLLAAVAVAMLMMDNDFAIILPQKEDLDITDENDVIDDIEGEAETVCEAAIIESDKVDTVDVEDEAGTFYMTTPIESEKNGSLIHTWVGHWRWHWRIVIKSLSNDLSLLCSIIRSLLPSMSWSITGGCLNGMSR